MFAIGDKDWPGISKLAEECGEVLQVIGKLIGTAGREHHWDGSNLRERLEEELGDLGAAIWFVMEANGLSFDEITERIKNKMATFKTWHANADKLDAELNALADDTGRKAFHDDKAYFCPGCKQPTRKAYGTRGLCIVCFEKGRLT